MDGGAWWAIVHEVTKESATTKQLKLSLLTWFILVFIQFYIRFSHSQFFFCVDFILNKMFSVTLYNYTIFLFEILVKGRKTTSFLPEPPTAAYLWPILVLEN